MQLPTSVTSVQRGASTADERVYLAIKALRIIRKGRVNGLGRAFTAFPGMRVVPDGSQFLGPQHIDRIQTLLQESVNMAIGDRTTELEATKDLPEYIRAKESLSLPRWVAQWAPKRRRIGLSGIREVDGQDILNKCIAFRRPKLRGSDVLPEPSDDVCRPMHS